MTSSLVITANYPYAAEKSKPQMAILIHDNAIMDKSQLRQILAANMQKAMEERGFNQQDLERRSGVAQSHISRIKRMTTSATIDRLAAISHALGCQPWELLVNDAATRRAAMERMLMGGDSQSTGGQLGIPIRQPEIPKRIAHKRKAKK